MYRTGVCPDDPAQHEAWLTESADLVAEAVAAGGDEPVWTFTGPRLAGWWARRREHEIAVHLADAEPGHAKAGVAVRAPAARLLLLLTRRLPASEPGVETFGEQGLLTHWLEHTPF